MNIIKPKKLKKGDTIGILALSGEIKKKSELLRAKEYFEQKGYKIVLSENVFDRKRYLAGSDEDKVSQLHKFFEADNIDAILCARGGYGAIRLLNKIDYDIIRKNPKIFAGYSDITALSAMFYKKSGLVTFQAPMALGDFGGNEISAHTERSFFSILKGEKTDLKPDFRKLRVYREGGAEGAFWGGNLSTVVSLCGVDFVPDEPFIFFAEDVCEPVYKLDKMFTQLLNVDKFRKNLSGIILGDFLNVDNKKYLEDLLEELAQTCKVPMQGGFRFTHGRDKDTTPYGVKARFSTSDSKIIFDKCFA